MEINAYDKKSKKILIRMTKYDKYNHLVFDSDEERKEFIKHIKHGGMPSLDLLNLIDEYREFLSKENREHIEYLYAQATNDEFDETKYMKNNK